MNQLRHIVICQLAVLSLTAETFGFRSQRYSTLITVRQSVVRARKFARTLEGPFFIKISRVERELDRAEPIPTRHQASIKLIGDALRAARAVNRLPYPKSNHETQVLYSQGMFLVRPPNLSIVPVPVTIDNGKPRLFPPVTKQIEAAVNATLIDPAMKITAGSLRFQTKRKATNADLLRIANEHSRALSDFGLSTRDLITPLKGAEIWSWKANRKSRGEALVFTLKDNGNKKMVLQLSARVEPPKRKRRGPGDSLF